MRKMIELVPAIDIIGGKCVRLTQGDYSRKTEYGAEPADIARQFEECGIKRLHMVDLDGARSNHIVNYRVLEKVAAKTSLTIDFGGGLKSDDDIRIAFECGAAMVTGGSIAVKERDKFLSWIGRYGSDKIILGADVKNGNIAVSGWEETSDMELIDFIAGYMESGIRKTIATDISRDGMLEGPSVGMYKEMLQKLPGLYVIASGGVSSMADIEKLAEAGVPSVIFGKAIYEGRITVKELGKYIVSNQ